MVPDSELLFPRPRVDDVIDNLTDFFYSESLQAEIHEELRERQGVIDVLQKKATAGIIEGEDVADVLQLSNQSLNALISIQGMSQERFLGIFSLKSIGGKPSGVPMSMGTIRSKLRRNRNFALELAELLLYGRTDPQLVDRVPPFDLEKLDRQKLLLNRDALIDSLLRLGLKGRYDAKKGSILEDRIEEVLKRIGVSHVRGEITLPGLSRKLDFVVPDTTTPYILIESGIFETTARELSDKGRVELLGVEEIERKYPQARFIRVTDGIGWRRRRGQDLSNLIKASHYFLVFKTLGLLDQIVKHHVPTEFFSKGGPDG